MSTSGKIKFIIGLLLVLGIIVGFIWLLAAQYGWLVSLQALGMPVAALLILWLGLKLIIDAE